MSSIQSQYKKHFKSTIFLTKFAIWVERIWPITLSFFLCWAIYACLGLLGIIQSFSDISRFIILCAFIVISIVIFIIQIKRIPKVTFKEVIQRIEKVNHLSKHPLQILYDKPIHPETQSIWDDYLRRIFKQIPKIKAGFPEIFKLNIFINDVTLAALICIIGLVIYNGDTTLSRLKSAFHPGYDDFTVALPSFQAWIIPPSYTNNAPIYIKSRTETINTDQNGQFHAIITDLPSKPSIISSDKTNVLHNISINKIDPDHWQIIGNLQNSGILTINARGRNIATWHCNIINNTPPQITWINSIQKREFDWKTSFPFKVTQHYGINKIQLKVTLPKTTHHPELNLVEETLAFGDSPKLIKQTIDKDFSDSIWGNEQATAIITAWDVSGHNAQSKPANFQIQSRVFETLASQKLNQIRQDYGQDKLSKNDAIIALSSLQDIPNAFHDYDLYLNLSSIIYFLDIAEENTQQIKDEALTRLWKLTVDVEERSKNGSEIARANADIQNAQAQVKEQLDNIKRLGKDKVTDQDRQELYRRMQYLQSAIARKMSALTKQSPNNQKNDEIVDPSDIQSIASSSFEDMFRKMEQSINKGDIDQATQDLEKTSQAMNNVRAATTKDLQELAKELQKQKDMKELEAQLSQLTQKQQTLLDQSNQRNTQSVPILLRPVDSLSKLSTPALLKEIGSHPPQKQSDQHKNNNISFETSATNQQALMNELHELQSKIETMTKQPMDNLSNASDHMQNAYSALTQKDDHGAIQYQEKVLTELQKVNQSLKQQLQQEAQKLSQIFPMISMGRMQTDPSSSSKENQDPLGRKQDISKKDMNLDNDATNANKIEDELHQRIDEPNRSEKEIDYIRRLLNIF